MRKYYDLTIYYTDKTKQPDYPMGEPQEFENLKEFIEFNVEQAEMIVEDVPQFEEVILRLLEEDFEVELDSDGEDEFVHVNIRGIELR